MYRYLLLILLGFMGACSSDHTDAGITTNADTLAFEVVADSVRKPRPDGTKVGASLEQTRSQLPETLLRLLNKNHPNWKLPELLPLYYEKSTNLKQGPFYITGDFTGNNSKDYAVQIQKGETVIVLAYLMNESGAREVKLTEAQVLKPQNSSGQSMYYLTLAPKDDEVYDYSTDKKYPLPKDAITVGIENSATTYLFEKGKFKIIPTDDSLKKKE
ncbi:MAG: hypothetical protein LPJ89_08970 [Hymenobacteraceae bacterium]|nr:hypothetical protein [Hymenobacteraceae bacterium]